MNARPYAWLCALLTAACTGTDTGNPPVALDAFDTSACKGAPQPDALMSKGIEPHASVRDAVHDGFICTLWDRSDDETLRVEFTNYQAPCGASLSWQPRIEQGKDGAIDIYLDNEECIFAGCGYCIYDLSFTARIPASTGDVQVRLYGDACFGARSERPPVTLPLAQEPTGSACTRYRPRAFGEGFMCGRPGPRWGYCVLESSAQMMCNDRSPSACEDGLKCTRIDDHGAICLPVCQSDADCADAGPTLCDEGVCRLSATGAPTM